MKPSLAIGASILAVIGNTPYILHSLRGKVRPHLYTWLIGSIVSAVVIGGQLWGGAGIGVLPTIVAECFTFAIFGIALFHLRKYGPVHITRTDSVLLFLCLLGLIPWMYTSDPTYSVVWLVGIDILSFIPTFRKTWQHPGTEHSLLYTLNVARHILSLGALEAYSVATATHSVAMVVMNSVLVAFIWYRHFRL